MKWLVALFFISAVLAEGFTNVKVNRNIDLSTQVATHTIDITLRNDGSSSISKYQLAIESALANHIAHISAVDDHDRTLEVHKGESKSNYVTYEVRLLTGLQSKASTKITVRAAFTHTQSPLPQAIAQSENQYVVYNDNTFFFSPYKTESQTTIVKLATSSVEKYSHQSPVTQRGDTITYGPYEDLAAFSTSALRVHYQNNRPFITVTSLVKEIEISHWGNVAVEETYQLQHDGARLKGTFSRFEYQRNRNQAPAHVPQLVQYLPVEAQDVYYRDEIGNITSSFLFQDGETSKLELIPRFPLFGGWKTGFYMGYNLPLSGYLFTDYNDGSRYVLNITFSTNFDDVVIDEETVRVILPEGARNVEFATPFALDGNSADTHFTYLDTVGRPVLVLNKRNLVPGEHNKYFQVAYTFSRTSMLQEPLLLIGAFFFFFFFIMIYVRLDLNIGGHTVEVDPSIAVEKRKKQQ